MTSAVVVKWEGIISKLLRPALYRGMDPDELEDMEYCLCCCWDGNDCLTGDNMGVLGDEVILDGDGRGGNPLLPLLLLL